MTAAVFCRAGRQDDGAGHQNLQQDHQDEVEVDLKWMFCMWKDLENMMRRKQKENKRGFVTLTAEGFRTSLHPNQTRQVVVTAKVDT